MIRTKDDKAFFKKISLFICLVFLIGIIITVANANAQTYSTEPSFTVKIDSITPNPAIIGEDITVSGTITPQPFETTQQKKQIVLVLDVSGSMGYNNKISNLKIAAKNFITKMSNQKNMEIAVIAFSNYATINPTLAHHQGWNGSISYDKISSKSIDSSGYSSIPKYISSGTNFLSLNNSSNITNLNNIIDGLEALGGTNTGEGLRKAEHMLENGDSKANKSIVFMSDGLPTYYSVNGTDHTYYTNIDNSDPYYAGSGQEEYTNIQNSKAYAVKIGGIIKNKTKPNVFSIGYGLGSETSTGNITMQDIHKSMGGVTGTNGTFFATDENAIDGVFNSIADKIMEKCTLRDMKINFESAVNFNSNFILNAGGKVVNIGNVNYTLQSRTDGKIVYEAAPIPFSFTIKGNVDGNYNDIFQGGKLTVPWNDQLLSSDLPSIGVTINENKLPNIVANIVSQNPDPAIRSQDITLKAETRADNFKFNSTIFDTSGPKDVIFVVDTSNSMSSLVSIKNGLFGKIANSGIKNAKYGIVTFNSSIKDDYVSGGLTDSVNIIDSAIKNIPDNGSGLGRNVGDALESAKNIFSNSGRSNSAKYIVLIASDDIECTDQQLYDIKNSKFNIITVNLGEINPPKKVNNIVIPGDKEPNNNIKDFHYNLIGKVDNGDNILQKEENNYFININYSLVTNQNNPDAFFTKEENANQMNNDNEVHNWILPLVAEKIKNGAVPMQVPSYTFKTKLKFNLNGKFDSVSGFNTCSDVGYDVETPEFDVTYKLINGEYVADPISDKYFTIRIKAATDINNLYFGPGIVSYTNLSNKPASTNINAYHLSLKAPIQIKSHGVYEGIINNQPSIIDGSTQTFNVAKGANVKLGATMYGSLDNTTDIRLEIPNQVTIDKTIDVYTYDDKGNLTNVGKMVQSTSDSIKTTYKYSGQAVTEKNILILYNETLPNTAGDYRNSLYGPDNYSKDVTISVKDSTNNSPELF